MSTTDQIGSNIDIFDNADLSFGNTWNADVLPLTTYSTSKLFDGALFIVSNGTCKLESIPENWRHPVQLLTETFDDINRSIENPENFFLSLIEVYINLYKIHLHLIVYHGNEYRIFDENKFLKSNEEPLNQGNHAFILCNADNRTYYPLYVNVGDEYSITIFKGNDASAWARVKFFIEKLNEQLKNQTNENSNLSTDDFSSMAVDDNPAVVNTSSATILQQTQDPITAYKFIKDGLKRINQLAHRLKPELSRIYIANNASEYQIPDIHPLTPQINAALIQLQLLFISDCLELLTPPITTMQDDSSDNHQENIVQRNENENSTNIETTLSNTTEVSQATLTVPQELSHESPAILIQPKGDWHYRNMKELGKKGMPLLNGEGGQRTPIRVTVPAQGNDRMYLGVKVQTHDNRDHLSKILVPEKTKVSLYSFCNDNDLNRLQFDECNLTDHFDPVHRCVYLEISSQEHTLGHKDVRVIMFNLYQSGSITRQLVDEGQLHICKLAFWLSILKNGIYEPVSPISQTQLIEES